MGTIVSLDIPNAEPQIFEQVSELLDKVDARFSTYKKDSEVSRFAAGRLKEADVSTELKYVIAQCKKYERVTNGYFSADYKGNFDPSGFVKGWSIKQSAELIEKNGYKTFCIGIGGDVLARSQHAKVWAVGISDPADTRKIVAAVKAKNLAIATSGNYERGKHIYNPKTKKPVDFWQSVTIMHPDIINADVMATTAFAMGQKAPAELIEQKLDFLFIDKKGGLMVSEGAEKLLGYS